jgi:aspartyl-tRNA(Asn)/glutamyl-tRNA(Gln) amidotransferase subunit C
MKVSENDVAYLAALANLALTDEERGRFIKDLNSILDYVDHLNELDTTGVEPMTRVPVSGETHRNADAARDDILHGLRESLPHEVALQNAAETDGTFFIVPKVIEK